MSQLLGAQQVDVVCNKEGPGTCHCGPPPGDKCWRPKVRSPLWFCKLGRRQKSACAGNIEQHETPSQRQHLHLQLASATNTSMFSDTQSISPAPLAAKELCQSLAHSLKLERCSSALPSLGCPARCCQAHLLRKCLVLPSTDCRQGFPAFLSCCLSIQVNCKTEPVVSITGQGPVAHHLAGSGFAHMGANSIG